MTPLNCVGHGVRLRVYAGEPAALAFASRSRAQPALVGPRRAGAPEHQAWVTVWPLAAAAYGLAPEAAREAAPEAARDPQAQLPEDLLDDRRQGQEALAWSRHKRS